MKLFILIFYILFIICPLYQTIIYIPVHMLTDSLMIKLKEI